MTDRIDSSAMPFAPQMLCGHGIRCEPHLHAVRPVLCSPSYVACCTLSVACCKLHSTANRTAPELRDNTAYFAGALQGTQVLKGTQGRYSRVLTSDRVVTKRLQQSRPRRALHKRPLERVVAAADPERDGRARPAAELLRTGNKYASLQRHYRAPMQPALLCTLPRRARPVPVRHCGMQQPRGRGCNVLRCARWHRATFTMHSALINVYAGAGRRAADLHCGAASGV
jgi:hypothetical protein